MKQLPDLHFEESISDHYVEERLGRIELPTSRAVLFLVGILSVVLGLGVIGRVVVLNVARGEFYENRAAANVYKEERTPANRGLITDRYGEILASNQGAFSVFLDTAEMLKLHASLEDVIKPLSESLSLTREEIIEPLRSFNFETGTTVALIRDITPNEVIIVEGLNLPGIYIEDDYVRTYNDAESFAHIIGYTGLSSVGNVVEGKTGIEAQYDELLRGQDGTRILYRDAKGNTFGEKAFFESIAGKDLTTTIDADFQRYFAKRLQEGVRILGRTSGVGIAMNPNNGEILSLVSLPTFDNNAFVDRSKSVERSALLNDTNRALFNRAISGIYSPGSTIKPLVALAALREKLVTPNTDVFSKGFVEIPNPYIPEEPSRFLDWKQHGLVDLKSALARSSNIYFYAVGSGLNAEQTGTRAIQGLGIERLKKYWEQFGFGAKTGIDLPSESEGLLPDPEYKKERKDDIWRIGDTLNVSIGQGDLLVSPLQLISFFSSLANGGTIITPHITSEENPHVVAEYTDWNSELKEIQEGLIDAVKKPYGTANLLSTLPMSAAGKTGSAQTTNNTRTNAFFIGYAPAENPKVAILILVENAREGSSNTLPIARDVLNWYYENRIASDKVIDE